MSSSLSSGGVSAELHRLASRYGFAVQDNVVLTRGPVSAVINHVVVDRYGVLLVASESHVGASIFGTETGDKWTATFSDGHVAEIRNPLLLNGSNESLVRQTLADQGVNLDSDEVGSAVVFAGADISHLELVDVSASKVKTTKNLAELFEARYSFPLNSGRLTEPDIKDIMSILAELAQFMPFEEDVSAPWHADPAVGASISAAMVGGPPSLQADASYQRSFELAGHLTGSSEGPSVRAALLTLGTIVVIILTVTAGIFFLPQLQAGSPAAWTAALVLLVALAEIVAANIAVARPNAGKPRFGGALGGALRFALRLAVVSIIVTAGWVFIAGGVADRIGASLASQFEPPTQYPTTPARPPADPGVVIAKIRLKETEPQVYKAVLDLDSPSIHGLAWDRTSYTWSYTPKGSSVPASFTLTIDDAGKIVSK